MEKTIYLWVRRINAPNTLLAICWTITASHPNTSSEDLSSYSGIIQLILLDKVLELDGWRPTFTDGHGVDDANGDSIL